MIDENISMAKREQLVALCSGCDISIEELDNIVQPIIESCTKEAISVSLISLFLLVVNYNKLIILFTHNHVM